MQSTRHRDESKSICFYMFTMSLRMANLIIFNVYYDLNWAPEKTANQKRKQSITSAVNQCRVPAGSVGATNNRSLANTWLPSNGFSIWSKRFSSRRHAGHNFECDVYLKMRLVGWIGSVFGRSTLIVFPSTRHGDESKSRLALYDLKIFYVCLIWTRRNKMKKHLY